jgi:hypothetical protein
MLGNISFKGSDISGIYLSDTFKELKGASLDVSQALDVAKILGVKITFKHIGTSLI